MFVVKIFSWGRRTTKIKRTKTKRTNICVQYTRHVFNYRGLPHTMKISLHENSTSKKIDTKFSQITVYCTKHAVQASSGPGNKYQGLQHPMYFRKFQTILHGSFFPPTHPLLSYAFMQSKRSTYRRITICVCVHVPYSGNLQRVKTFILNKSF